MRHPDTVEDIIRHYSSPNYDPVKAHEYYLKTRQLVGKHSTKGFNKKQREAAAFVRNQVGVKKKQQIDAAREVKKSSIEEVRAQAHQLRMDISEKLRAFSAALSKERSQESLQITKDSREQRHQIQAKLDADIAAIPEVPKNLPKAQREKLLADRAEKIQKLRDKAGLDRQALTEDTAANRTDLRTAVKDTRSQNQESVDAQRAKVAGELKAVVAKYIEQYRSSKEQIKSQSEATLDREFQNIRTKVR